MSDQISLPESVRFQDTELSIIDHNGTPWLTSADLARALKFAKTDAVTRLYNRSKDEFDASMTETVTVTVSGNLQKKVRIFSPRGCHLIAMLARTERAKEFRKWVLDVLEQLSPVAGGKENPNLPTRLQVRNEALNMVREMLPALRQELLEGLRPMSRDISLHSLLGDVSTGQGRLLGVWEDLPAHNIQWPNKALAERHEYVVLGYWAETRLPTVMRLYAGNWIIASQLAVYLHPDFRFVAAFEADASPV
jgi:prophage antirepressor-like protein|tara:strand:+ start:18299 stop:19048 length:750 start_codon:yes stop_codon:yes gene_type:complete